MISSCDGRVVKASDSKSDGFSRVGSNPTRSASFFLLSLFRPQMSLFFAFAEASPWRCSRLYPTETDDSVCIWLDGGSVEFRWGNIQCHVEFGETRRSISFVVRTIERRICHLERCLHRLSTHLGEIHRRQSTDAGEIQESSR